MGYLDDLILCADTYDHCQLTVTDTGNLFSKLGFKKKNSKSQTSSH